ncbi:MAG: hypothetical protein RL190_345 [Actinomycetota bacterium]
MPRRLVHAADLHLDSPFTGLGSVRDGLDEVLLDASLDALDDLVELCLAEEAELLLLAGDQFDRAEGSSRGRQRLARACARLTAAGTAVFAVHGNHDPLRGRSPLADVEGVTVFRPGRPQAHAVDPRGLGPVVVHGVSFGRAAEEDNLALGFARGDEPGLHVGLLHCMVGDREGHGRYAPCSLDHLLAAKMDYWALGHVHRFTVEHEAPPVVYAGALQGRSPKPSERGPHGAVVVEFEGERVLGLRHVALDRVRFEEVELTIDGLEGEQDLTRALEGLAAEAVRAADGRLVILRARLSGRGELHRLVSAAGELESLRRGLDEAAGPDLVWERIRAATGPAVDLDGVRAGQGLPSAALAAFDALADDPAELAALHAELTRSLGDPALAGLAEEDPAARLAAARDLVLGLLLDAEEAA